MNEIYAEAGVKKKKTFGFYALRLLMIIVAAVAFLFSLQSSIMLIFAALFVLAIIYLFPRLNVEYEYIFCDGQLDFDKIMGNSKRKTVLRIDFAQVEIMAPEGSHALDNYNNIATTTKDFSSGNKEIKPYIIILRKNETKIKILFEPNEKMISCIKMKNQRKVAEY
jgi:hypothetical protein